jgi:hypothetical protein
MKGGRRVLGWRKGAFNGEVLDLERGVREE